MAEGLEALGITIRATEGGKDLGVDTTFGRQRRIPKQKKRGQKARIKLARIKRMVVVHKFAKNTLCTGALPTAFWGSVVHGLAPTTAEKLRRQAISAAGMPG
jgi:hypothetical protein